MRKSLKLSAGLLTVGAGSAVAAVDAADHGAKTLAVAAALLAGACTALSVTSAFTGWAVRPVDTESSASRQHYVDTGRYLRKGETEEV
jgi:hypothetical protein